MAVKWNNEGLTKRQIEMAEPLRQKIADYDRKIDHERTNKDIVNEDYEKARNRKNKIAKLNESRKQIVTELEVILNAREDYNKLFTKTEDQINELARLKELYGF